MLLTILSSQNIAPIAHIKEINVFQRLSNYSKLGGRFNGFIRRDGKEKMNDLKKYSSYIIFSAP